MGHSASWSIRPLFTLLPGVRVLGSPYAGFRITRAPIAPSSPLAAGPARGGDHNILWGWIKMREGECSTGRREREFSTTPFSIPPALQSPALGTGCMGWFRSSLESVAS